MKVLFVGLAVLALVCAGWAQSPTDEFHITVTVNMLGVSLYQDDGTSAYGTWALGNMAAGATASMTFDNPDNDGDNHVEAENDGNCAADISVYSTESSAPGDCGFGTPTAWAPGAAAGSDIYYLECGEGSESSLPGSYTACDQSASPGTEIVSNLASGSVAHLFFNFTTPTSVSDGCEHDITVTVLASTP